jgi:hypothetical protein
MRIRVWNAYASNNSGSHTIVGRLPSAEVAERTANELRDVIDAHTAWRETWDGKTSLEESPLAQFCKSQGLPWSEGDGGWDDWPEHSDDNRPHVVVSRAQVIVHHEYTVSLPPTFGALFYKRGGRVEYEENHAHHPIVVIAKFYWGWSKEQRAVQDIELPRLLAALTGADGTLTASNLRDVPSAWRAGGDRFDEAPLTVGVVFDDLVAGVAALRGKANAHAAQLELRLAEAQSDNDPLIHLRPSSPAVPRFDVVITNLGENQSTLVKALADATGRYEHDARDLLRRAAPIPVARALIESRARTIADGLAGAGATTELRRNDA